MFDFNQVVETKKTSVPSRGKKRYDQPVMITPEADAKRNTYTLNEAASKMLEAQAGHNILILEQSDEIFVINFKDGSNVVDTEKVKEGDPHARAMKKIFGDAATLYKNLRFTSKGFAEVTSSLENGTAYTLEEVKDNNLPNGCTIVKVGSIYGEESSEISVEETDQEQAVVDQSVDQEEENTIFNDSDSVEENEEEIW